MGKKQSAAGEELAVPIELVDRGLVPQEEVIPEPLIDVPTPVVLKRKGTPVAELVLDDVNGPKWLQSSYLRLVGAYKSIVYLGEGIPSKQVSFLASLARKALKKGGVLLVPNMLSKLPSLEDMQMSESAWEGFVSLAEK